MFSCYEHNNLWTYLVHIHISPWKQSSMHWGEGCIQYDNNTNMKMIKIVLYLCYIHNNSSTYLLHKCICNKVTFITNCYNEKHVMYIPNLVNVMYIKRILSLWLTCLFASIMQFCWKITLYTSVCPPYISIKKCYVYKQSRQCYVYKNEYSLLLTNFELSLEIATNMKITWTC